MSGDNRPWSEQFRLAAKAWVELDNAANMLEESKSAVLSQRALPLRAICRSTAPRWPSRAAQSGATTHQEHGGRQERREP